MQSSELLATRRQNSVPVTPLGQPYGEHAQSVAKLSRMKSNQESLTLASCSATQSKSSRNYVPDAFAEQKQAEHEL